MVDFKNLTCCCVEGSGLMQAEQEVSRPHSAEQVRPADLAGGDLGAYQHLLC